MSEHQNGSSMRSFITEHWFASEARDRAMDVHLRLLAEAASIAIAGAGELKRSISRTVARPRD